MFVAVNMLDPQFRVESLFDLCSDLPLQMTDMHLFSEECSGEFEGMTVSKHSRISESRHCRRIRHRTAFSEVQMKPHVQIGLTACDVHCGFEGRCGDHQARRLNDTVAASDTDRFIHAVGQSEIISSYDELLGRFHEDNTVYHTVRFHRVPLNSRGISRGCRGLCEIDPRLKKMIDL